MDGSTTFKGALLRAPMLRLAVPFVVGLVMAASLPKVEPWIPLVALVLACAGWAVLAWRPWSYRRRWCTGVTFPLVSVLLGWCTHQAREPLDRADHLSRFGEAQQGWRVTVQELVSEQRHVVRFWARVDAVVADGRARRATGGLLVTWMKDSSDHVPAPGHRLVIMGRVSPLDRVPDPGGFDPRAWAASRQVYHECFVRTGSAVPLAQVGGWTTLFEDMRQRIGQWLRGSGLPARERALVKAVLLGLRDEMDAGQKDDFIRSGTVHVLAVSGSHVAIIYVALWWALGFFGGDVRGRWARGLVILAALWCYAGITGLSPSVLRATITFSLVTVAQMAGARTGALNSLAAAGFLLLFGDPGMLSQVGFQLSFLAVLGIVMFYRPLLDRWSAPGPVFGYFWSLLCVSLSAQVFTLPLTLYVFHAFPVWFLPANLIVVGLVTLGVYGGIALLVFHQVPVLGPALALLMEALLRLLGATAGFFADLPGAYPTMHVGGVQCVALYVLLLAAAAWMLGVARWAKWPAVVALAVFLVGGWAQVHERNRQAHFVVYDDRSHVLTSVVQGRAMVAFAAGADPRLLGKVERHRRALGLDTVVWEMELPAAVSVPGGRVIFDPVPSSCFEVNEEVVLVLTADQRYDLEAVRERLTRVDQVVLLPTMPPARRSWVRSWCRDRAIRVHDVKLQGAYVRTYDRGAHPMVPGP